MFLEIEKNIGDKVRIKTINGWKEVEIESVQINYICKLENGKHVLVAGERIKK